MTCHRIPGGIICTGQRGRLHVVNRYYWVDYTPNCGPTFYYDAAMEHEYEPKGEKNLIWDAFQAWLDKREAK